MTITALEALTGKTYLSYSSVDTLMSCGQKFKLERVDRVPTGDAWYFLGGKAVHTATELLDQAIIENTDAPSVEEAWTRAWTEQLNTVDDPGSLRVGGRASKAWPDKENQDWWAHHGAVFVKAWDDWRAARLADGWTLYGIETPFDVLIGSTRVKGFIDRVFITDDGEPLVCDIKTGSHAPGSSLQLGVYRHGARRSLGIDPLLGSYWMARKDEQPPQLSLLHYSDDYLGRFFDKARAIIEQELFVPHPTSLCGTCLVAPWCPAMGGTEPVPGHFTTNKEGVAA